MVSWVPASVLSCEGGSEFPKTLRPSPHLGLALVSSQNLVPGWRELPGYGGSLGTLPQLALPLCGVLLQAPVDSKRELMQEVRVNCELEKGLTNQGCVA